MKHLVFFFFVCGLLLGQSNKTIYELPTATAMGTDDFFVMYDNGLGTTNKIAFGSLGLTTSLLSANNTWTGANYFTGSLQAPSTISAGLVRGIGFNSDEFAWVSNDTVRIGADRAWVLNAMDTAGLAGATSNFVTKDGSNALTGTNIFTGIYGTGIENTGQFWLPYYSSGRPADAYGSFYLNASDYKLRIYTSAGWKTYLDSVAVKALVTTGSYWTTSTAQTGLAGSKTISTGGLRYVSGATSTSSLSAMMGTPVYTSLPAVTNYYNGDLAQVSGETDDDGSGEELHGLYFLYTDQDYNKIWGFLPDQDKVERLVDGIYSYNTPATSSAESDTLYFTDRNYIQTVYTPQIDGTTLFINDDYYGAVSIIVMGSQEDTPIIWSYDTALTNGIKWVGNVAPTFDYHVTTKYYEVLLKRLNATTILGSWTYYQ